MARLVLPQVLLLLASTLDLLQTPRVHALLWFADAPNNLGDFDGLTTKDGTFYLRYNNGACASPNPCNDACEQSGPGGHCKMNIHSYGSATSPDGVHWTDHGTMMTQFDEGKTCPNTGSGSGSVWKSTSPTTSPTTNGSGKKDTYVINYSHGGVIRFMTAPAPAGPWTPVGSTAPANKTFADGFGPGRRPARPQDGREWYDGRWDTANGWHAPASSSPASPKMYFWISATAIGQCILWHALDLRFHYITLLAVAALVCWPSNPRDAIVCNAGANNTKQVGHASSLDGLNWDAQPPAVVTDWRNHSFKGGPFESGGCAYVASVKKWYCLNGKQQQH